MDEARLVKYCKENNALAQKALYNTYVDPMMLLCLRYIEDREDAREALMDGFLNCFRNISGFTYRGEGSLRAWLKKIMVNQCLMRLRRKQPVFISHSDHMPVEASYPENASDAISAKEILGLVHALPDGCRTVFNLHVFEGMGHKEIAELLEISEGTSKSQLHRARLLLKETLSQTSQHIL
jgi:RNA polymerase sigma-70 factor (ECF subfamily)